MDSLFQHGLLKRLSSPPPHQISLKPLPKTKSVDWVGSQHFQNAKVRSGVVLFLSIAVTLLEKTIFTNNHLRFWGIVLRVYCKQKKDPFKRIYRILLRVCGIWDPTCSSPSHTPSPPHHTHPHPTPPALPSCILGKLCSGSSTSGSWGREPHRDPPSLLCPRTGLQLHPGRGRLLAFLIYPQPSAAEALEGWLEKGMATHSSILAQRIL